MTAFLKCLSKIALFSWFIGGIGVAVLAYWYFIDDATPVIINSVSILPDAPHHAGDSVILHVDVCQTRPGIPGTGVRMIRGPETNGYAHFLSETYIDPLVECTRHDRPIMLPRDLPPGKYQYVFQGVYQINPIKTKVFTQPPIPFEIVP